MNRFVVLLAMVGTGCNCAGSSVSGLTAELSITCQTATNDPTIQCEEVDFGNVEIGGSAERAVRVVNNGRGKLLFAFADWDPATTSFTASALPADLAGGAVSTFKLTFAPLVGGSAESNYAIVSNAKGKARVQIHVLGNGVAEPKAHVSPAAIDFGNIAVGATESRTITVQNTDTVPILVTNGAITMGGAVFALTLPPDSTIAPSGTLEVTATYSPTEAGSSTGEATVRILRVDTPSATPTASTVTLTGRSVPVIQVDPTSLVFGDHTVGSRTQSTITIKNIGVAPLDVQTIVLAPNTSSTFSLVAPIPQGVTLQPQASVVASVLYLPVRTTDISADLGAVTIASTDPATPTVTVPLTAQCTNCNGPPPNLCSTARSCDCGVQSACTAGGGCIPARRVFVSRAMTTANLGGLAGADQLCNTYATDAVLGGTWKAFLADSSGAPASRFTAASVPYALLDGTVVANDFSGLTSGSLSHGITVNECGEAIDNAEVWTGISSPGATSASNQCDNFTSASGNYAQVGLTTRTNYQWYSVYLQFCDRSNVRLYCVEQ